MTTLPALKLLMEKADEAVRNNVPAVEGGIYVTRGDSECLVAKPQCAEWAAYLAGLIRAAPSLIAIAEAAQAIVDNNDRYGVIDDSWWQAAREALAALTAQELKP